MAKKSKSTRITIQTEAGTRGLLSVSENASGDLILNLYLKQLGGGTPAPFADIEVSDRGRAIAEHRYSVHASPDSEHNVNTIKLHMVYEDGETEFIYQNTAAIKRDLNFAPIYARMCSTLADPGYDIKSDGKMVISLGRSTAEFTLVFAVFVGPTETAFHGRPISGSMLNLRFGTFSIVVLWSFLTIPSTGHGRQKYIGHLDRMVPTTGFSPQDCLSFFDQMRADFKAYQISIVEPILKNPRLVRRLHASTYLREARRDTREFRQWMERIRPGQLL